MRHFANDHKAMGIQPYQTHCWGAVMCGKCLLVFAELESYFSFLWWFFGLWFEACAWLGPWFPTFSTQHSWVIGGEVDFQECILVVVVIIVSAAKCQPLKQAVRGLAGGARTPHLLCKPCVWR